MAVMHFFKASFNVFYVNLKMIYLPFYLFSSLFIYLFIWLIIYLFTQDRKVSVILQCNVVNASQKWYNKKDS